MFTEEALAKVIELNGTEEGFPRIDANMVGGCGLTVTFSLVFDEIRKNDTVVECNGAVIRIDQFTKSYLGDMIHVDFDKEQGFRIGESFQAGSCSIEVE